MLAAKLTIFLLKKFFAKVENGELIVELPSGQKVTLASKNATAMRVSIRLNSYKLVPLLLLKGGLGAGESYIKGYWYTPDLKKILEFAATNRSPLSKEFKGYNTAKFFDKALHFFRQNSINKAKKNIAAHYDLGNNFYGQWLDESMTYSSAIFDDFSDTLQKAQNNKYARLCDLVELASDDSVLEIGCGWGGLINYIKRRYSCDTKAITISEEQYKFVTKKNTASASNDKSVVSLCDYRDLRGKFDKILSIEMIEAVGAKYWPVFFSKLKSSLKNGGVIGLQAITIAEDYYEDYEKNTDFIQRYIFPGGMLPTLEIIKLLSKGAGLKVITGHDYAQHYAATLEHWRDRFDKAWPRLKDQGFDDRFRRTWDYYLAYCQAGFSQGMLNVWQLRLEHDS